MTPAPGTQEGQSRNPTDTCSEDGHNFSAAAEQNVAGAPAQGCTTCQGSGVVFDCEHWPRCGCPGGTIHPGCPGRSKPCPDCPLALPAAGDLFHHPL